MPEPRRKMSLGLSIANLGYHYAAWRHPRVPAGGNMDFRHFVENAQNCWRMLVAERADGSLAGFLAAVVHPNSQMVGPGVMEDETAAAALLHAMLEAAFRGRSVIWLVPVQCAALVRQCYAWGARNVEMHLASVLGEAPPMTGVTFPTFMPETG